MDIAIIADRVAQALKEEANVRAVFGEPMKIDTKTIIPVAIVVAAVGGGVGESRLGSGGGGGFDVRAIPFGFIHEEDGVVRFTELDVTRAVESAPNKKAIARVRERIAQVTGRRTHHAVSG